MAIFEVNICVCMLFWILILNTLFRNANIRREAREEQKRLAYTRLETQVFNARCSAPPSFIQFHPYDQQIAIVGRETFG